jgi:hypothetical protein
MAAITLHLHLALTSSPCHKALVCLVLLKALACLVVAAKNQWLEGMSWLQLQARLVMVQH